MGKLITLPLQYNHSEYFLLVQVRKDAGYEDFHVTTITGDLDAKIYANYIFRWNGSDHTVVQTPADKLATSVLTNKIWHTIYNNIILEKQNS